MNKMSGWKVIVMSDLSHEHLVAELQFDGQIVAQLDREDGREAMCISLFTPSGQISNRIGLSDYLRAVADAAKDLAK